MDQNALKRKLRGEALAKEKGKKAVVKGAISPPPSQEEDKPENPEQDPK